MGVKIRWRSRLRTIRLLYKNMGIPRFIPVFATLVIDTAVCLISYYSGRDLRAAEMSLRSFLMLSVPLFSFWWEALVIKDYTEGEENETVFLPGRRIKLPEVLISYAAYYLSVIPCFAVYYILFRERVLIFFAFQLIIGFFLASIVYLSAFICKNTSVSFMLCLVYTVGQYADPRKHQGVPFLCGQYGV